MPISPRKYNMYIDQRITQFAVKGDSNQFFSFCKNNGKDPVKYLHYCIKHNNVELAEQIISENEEVDFSKLLFRRSDSSKPYITLLESINKEDHPNLYNFRSLLIPYVINLVMERGHSDRLISLIEMVEDVEKRNEIINECIKYSKESETKNRMNIRTAMTIYIRESLIDNILKID